MEHEITGQQNANVGSGQDQEQNNGSGNANPENAGSGVYEPPKDKSQWTNVDYIIQRKEEKLRKEYEAKMQQELEKVRSTANNYAAGAADPAALNEVVQDMAQDLMLYKVNDYVQANPHFAEHKHEIQEAIASGKYGSLGIDEVAMLVAGKSLLAKKQQEEAYNRNTPGTGSTARAFSAKQGLSADMSDKDVALMIEQSRRGNTFK